ncbi:heterokaryon incompatibility protein-domain-containing protein [Schizothecium vesticola]|uniref:Heterokaryon incompatibility protein-domain-containing protein n=1 Tax=Schizothecium vesticola TaxID=314040 RepID=A0AA40K591_9PEZI|nr:heterokaryon incompatibility protein-domain-containing protein [Schizothecium vesticola]
MRLLNVETFQFAEFVCQTPPPYAILSHTWGDDSEEVSYSNVLAGRLDSPETRPAKVSGCCDQARKDGYKYVWIDTCCIDKTNSVELQEAINSMFRWYREAAICYVYLADVPPGDEIQNPDSRFHSSRWFQRGWTLQELLAPLHLRFYDFSWQFLGTKGELCEAIEDITGIPSPYLLGIHELHHASIAQRMSWAASRVTKREEDIAYCLLGIFDIAMPMIYGEGPKAFQRLQKEIVRSHNSDDSILAWGLYPHTLPSFSSALAIHPSQFASSGQIVSRPGPGTDSLDAHTGPVRLNLRILPQPGPDEMFGALNHPRGGTRRDR